MVTKIFTKNVELHFKLPSLQTVLPPISHDALLLHQCCHSWTVVPSIMSLLLFCSLIHLFPKDNFNYKHNQLLVMITNQQYYLRCHIPLYFEFWSVFNNNYVRLFNQVIHIIFMHIFLTQTRYVETKNFIVPSTEGLINCSVLKQCLCAWRLNLIPFGIQKFILELFLGSGRYFNKWICPHFYRFPLYCSFL
jgi:hypothetical protein